MKGIQKRPAWRELLFPLLLVIAVSLAVYANTLGNAFVYDDDFMVVRNPWITNFRFIPNIFSNNVFRVEITNYYRPMIDVIFMFAYYIFGPMPWGFHLVNVVLHTGSSVLVFLIARILFSEYKSPSQYLSIPLMAAVLFAVHPIHTEAVAWVSGVMDLSYSFFCLLSLYLYIRSENRFNTIYYLSALAFFTGTLCKEPALLLPGLLIAYDLLLNKKKPGFKFILKRYALFALAASAYLCIRFYALGGNLAPENGYSEYGYFGNMFIVVLTYFKKLILPTNLTLFYAFKPVHSLFEARALTAVILTMLIIVLFYIAYKKDKVAFFCLLVIAVPLLPVIYIPALGQAASVIGERYLYLPSAGFCMLVSLAIARLAGSGRGRFAAASVFLALVALYSAGTVLRNRDWKDGGSLWADEVKKAPWSTEAHTNLGLYYGSIGRDDLAISEYLKALQCRPVIEEAYENLGITYDKLGMEDKAITVFEEMLKASPDDALAYNGLGVAYAKKGDMNKAAAYFQMAVHFSPDEPLFKQNLENTLMKIQK
jgi:tetratricopeptide (TPR) repeat protein